MTSVQYIQMANEAKIELTNAKKALSDYMGCRPLSKLKKEVDFLLLCDEVKKWNELWLDLCTMGMNQAKIEKAQKIFN